MIYINYKGKEGDFDGTDFAAADFATAGTAAQLIIPKTYKDDYED